MNPLSIPTYYLKHCIIVLFGFLLVWKEPGEDLLSLPAKMPAFFKHHVRWDWGGS